MGNNLIPMIAKELGVEIGEKFKIEDCYGLVKTDLFSFDTKEFCGNVGYDLNTILLDIICGKKEITKLPFKPKLGEDYYFVDADGFIEKGTWCKDVTHYLNYKFSNCFKTLEEAGLHKEEILAKFREIEEEQDEEKME